MAKNNISKGQVHLSVTTFNYINLLTSAGAKRNGAQKKVDLNIDEENFPDKYEILRDENIQLKTRHKELEE